MPHGLLHRDVRSVASIIVVEGGEHVGGINPVQKAYLITAKARSVDRKGIDPDVPEGNGVEGSFNQNDTASSSRRVVEEESPDIYPSGVSVLWPSILFQASANDTKDCSICSAERVSDSIRSLIKSKSKSSSSSLTCATEPVRVDWSCVPSGEPGFWVDTFFLHLLFEPQLHLQVVGLQQGVLSGQVAVGTAGVADPLLLDDVQRGAWSAVPVHRTEERTLRPPALGDRLGQGVRVAHSLYSSAYPRATM